MKHILEYEDIEGIYGDLKSLGVTGKEMKGTLWAHFKIYRLYGNQWTKSPVIVCFLETEPFYGRGDEERDKAAMLQQIQRGEFKRPSHPDARSWDSLRRGNEIAIDLMEKSVVQSRAKSCSTMDDFIEELREAFVASQEYALSENPPMTTSYNQETLYSYDPSNSTVLVYGFLGPQDSPYLVTADLDKPFMKGSDINYYKE